MSLRTVTIDFTAENPVGQRVGGYLGEHNATELLIIPPPEMTENAAVTAYAVVFTTGGKRVVSRTYGSSEKICVPIWQQLTQNPVLNVQLEAYDDSGELVAKSQLVYLALLPSARGTDTGTDYGASCIAAEIAGNTKARHEHGNMTVLDKLGASGDSLTYDGQPIKGGGSSTQSDWQQPDPAAVDYVKNRTHYDIPGYSVEWDGLLDGHESVLIVHSEEEGNCYMVRIADSIPAALVTAVGSDDVKMCIGGETASFTDLVEPVKNLFTVHDNYDDAISYLVNVREDECDVSASYAEVTSNTIILNRGLWVMRSDAAYVSEVVVPNGVKTIDLKYIPELAFGAIELEPHDGYSTVKVTDRDGQTTSVDIKDGTVGKTPVKGTDYWTDEDKAEIVSATIAALPRWIGGDY